jgi:hypothetical protein
MVRIFRKILARIRRKASDATTTTTTTTPRYFAGAHGIRLR